MEGVGGFMGATPSGIGAGARFFRVFRRNRSLLLLAVPGLVVLFLNQYLPIFGVIIAFKDVNYRDGIFKSPWAGLKNFEFLFATSDTFVAARNTLLYNFAFIILGLVCSVAIAVALNELFSKRLSGAFQSMIILPNFLSIIIVAYIVSTFLASQTGILNRQLLPALALPPVEWYMEPSYWPGILLLVQLWKSAGAGSIIYLASICGIDQEYYDAAVIDGASRFQQIVRITLPSLAPMMAILTILSLGNIFRSDFGLFYQVTMDSKLLYPATDVIDTYVYRSLLQLNDIGMASAASFVQSAVGCALLVGVNLIIRRIDDSYSLF